MTGYPWGVGPKQLDCKYLGLYISSLGNNLNHLNLFGLAQCNSKAGLNSGFSGGPVTNTNNEVIGVITGDLTETLLRYRPDYSNAEALIIFSPIMALNHVIPDLNSKKQFKFPDLVKIDDLIRIKLEKPGLVDVIEYDGSAAFCLDKNSNIIGTVIEKFKAQSIKFSVLEALKNQSFDYGPPDKFSASEASCN